MRRAGGLGRKNWDAERKRRKIIPRKSEQMDRRGKIRGDRDEQHRRQRGEERD